MAKDITRLINAASAGDTSANEALFDSVYVELQSIAKAQRRRWKGNETLNTTALIHEAYVKLAPGKLADYEDRTHFFATASRAMRQVLINYAERATAAKRGGKAIRITWTEELLLGEETVDDLLLINSVLDELQETNERHCRVFECRVFGGMTVEETATALRVSKATVKRDWSYVSSWVYQRVSTNRDE